MLARLARPPHRRLRSRAFTLLELLIAIVIAAIVLALSVPGFAEFFRNNRLAEAANGFLAATQLARTEAIKRQQVVAVCASADSELGDGASCSGGPFTAWIVFVDRNADCVRDADEPRVGSIQEPIEPSVRVRSSGHCAAFGADGFAVDLPAGVGAQQLLLCDERGLALQPGSEQSAARGIVVARTGRSFLTRDPDLISSWGLACP